jgi:hypothetical protein
VAIWTGNDNSTEVGNCRNWEGGLQPWDVAAGILMVREAGGFVSDFRGGDQMIAQFDAAFIGREQTRDRAQQSRLAATGGAQQRDEFAGLYREIDAVDGAHAAERLS